MHQFDNAQIVNPQQASTELGKVIRAPVQTVQNAAVEANLNQPLREARDDFERLYFEYHMKDSTNNMSQLAEIAGLERTHLYRKLKQLGIKIKG